MIAVWMVYGVAIGALLSTAATWVEKLFRMFGHPARLVWMFALLGTLGLPAVRWFAPGTASLGVPVDRVDPQALSVLNAWPNPFETLVSTQPKLAAWDSPLVLAWVLFSTLLLLSLLWSSWRLNRERSGWKHGTIGGASVLLSDDVGPAVLGVASATVVLPHWVLGLEKRVQRIIALHEREHIRGGDPWLLLLGLVALVLMPWNVALWWQMGRLRLALEADCDLRMIRGGVGVREYGLLLLEMHRRVRRRSLPALALTERQSSLSRRIKIMISEPRRRVSRVAGALAIAAASGFLACEAPTPPATSEVAEVNARLVQDTTLVYFQPTTIVLRGDSTLRRHPLYVVDGVIIGAGAIDIDALDIESIEVIKGEAARKLYGERAADGVVSITTRKPGTSAKKVEVVPF